MDPQANLLEQRLLRAKIRKAIEAGRAPDPSDVDRLLDLVEALDSWIASGGFLPSDWHHPCNHCGKK